MDENKKELFENAPISKAVTSLALPTVIGMLVMVFYNLVDTYFIGQTNDSIQVAAVSLAMPIFLILMACGNLFGIGASANISRYLGQQSYDKVNIISSFSAWSALALGIIVAIFSLLFMDNLVWLIGADELSFEYVKGYLSWLAYGAPFIIISNALSYLIRSEGNAKMAMFGMILSTITNIILDPIFIFTFDFGVVGAAMATVIANILSAIYYVYVLLTMKNTYLSIKLSDFKPEVNIVKDIFIIGIPASLNNVLMSVSSIMYNVYLAEYGNTPVAAMGIVTKMGMIYMMLFMGLATGVQPLFGYVYGANQQERLKEAVNYTLKVAVSIGVVCLVVFSFMAEAMIGGFIDDVDVIEQGAKMLQAQVLTAPFIGIIFVVTNLMQVAKKGAIALFLSVCRQGCLFIPAIIILDKMKGLEGLIFAQPLADVISVCLAIFIYYHFFQNFMTSKAVTPSIES